MAITFAVVFLLVGLLPVLHGSEARLWSLGLGLLFLAVGFAAPSLLRPLNILWFKLGLLLHHIMNPLVLGVLFFLGVTPMALLIRLLGKRLMPLQFDPESASYWIKRSPPGPPPESVYRQF